MTSRLLSLGLVMILAGACSNGEPEESVEVQLTPTQGEMTSGTLVFATTGDGVRVDGDIRNLTPDGVHGFHIHENGDCSAPDASSAGDHYAPMNAPHGDPDSDAHHMGDMGNIESDPGGTALVQHHLEGATLGAGSTSLRGRAVIVHAGPDDMTTQPDGDAGDRVACGVIPTF